MVMVVMMVMTIFSPFLFLLFSHADSPTSSLADAVLGHSHKAEKVETPTEIVVGARAHTACRYPADRYRTIQKWLANSLINHLILSMAIFQ